MTKLSLEHTMLHARGHERRGEMEEARKLYRAVLASFPQNERAKKALAALAAPKTVATGGAPQQAVLAQLVALYNQGQLAQAAQQAARLAEAFPAAVLVWQIFGVASKRLGRLADAEKGFRRAAELSPNSPDAHNNLGNILNEQGKLDEALASYRRALTIKPDYAEAHNNLGLAFNGQGRLDEAVASFRRALEIKPDYAEAYINLGLALNEHGKLDEAVASYHRALEIKPDYVQAYSNLGLALGEQGKFDEALASFQRALQIRPGSAETHRSLSAIKKYRPGDEQFDAMLRLCGKQDASDHDRCHLSFGISKAYDDLGDLELSFRFLKEGNDLRRKILGYRPDQDQRLFASIKAGHERNRTVVAPDDGKGDDICPIFILGMPRSGTTLVEQIVSSHSNVSGAGELKYASQLGTALATGQKAATAAEMRGFREGYLAKLAQHAGGKAFVTDKYPHNFLLVGLLAMAIPRARIIHVRRDARAVAWSNYRNYFAGRGLGYTCDLSDLVAYYRLYADLMEYWEAQYPGKIHPLSYEALTENPEDETRRLIDAIGLDWEDACLSPETNSRNVRTTSQQQVRRKIYTGSSQEWRKYEPFLNGAFDGLA